MKNLGEKIKRLGVLYKKGRKKGITREENQEFKSLEKLITDAMLKNEVIFDKHIAAFKRAINQQRDYDRATVGYILAVYFKPEKRRGT